MLVHAGAARYDSVMPELLPIPKRFATVLCDRIFSAIEAAGDIRFCIQVVLRFEDRLDEARLEQAARLSLEVEPHLACRFVERGYQPYWSRYDHLDEIRCFELRRAQDDEQTLQRVLAEQLGQEGECAVKVILIRGRVDVLCVKMDHKMGDGQAAKQYASLLAETYTRLAGNPHDLPTPRAPGDRSLAQITKPMTRLERRRLIRGLTRGEPLADQSAYWQLPAPDDPQQVSESSRFLIETIPAERYPALFQYACRHRATVNQVLMAAFLKAALAVIPHTPAPRLKILTTVDLRRYLPSKLTEAPCNMAGLQAVSVDTWADTLDAIVADVRDQMFAARKHQMGLHRSVWRLELQPLARFLFNCVPFRRLRSRMVDRWKRGRREGGVASQLCFTDIGAISPEAVTFSTVRPRHAFITSGTVPHPGILLLCLTEFSGMLTFSIGFDPRVLDGACAERLLRTLIDTLPE